MKKYFTLLCVLLLSFAMVVGLTACNINGRSNNGGLTDNSSENENRLPEDNNDEIGSNLPDDNGESSDKKPGASDNNSTGGSIVTSDTLEFTLDSEKKQYIVSGVAMYSPSEIIIPSTYENLPVVAIADYAFSGCTTLEKVTIPNSITSIGDGAFLWCESLVEIKIPSSVKTIGDLAFNECTSLKKITVDAANSNYKSSSDVLYSKNGSVLIQYPPAKDGSDFEIPKGVTSINPYAFSACSKLENVKIEKDVVSIDYRAFYHCTSLKTATLGNNVTTIGNDAFNNCENLKSITIGENVESIGNLAFFDCVNLTKVIIPDSVISIGDSAFEDCIRLKEVMIGRNVTSIGANAFYDCEKLDDIIILNTVKSIGNNAFASCNSKLYSTYESGKYVSANGNKYAILIGLTDTAKDTYKINENAEIIANNVFSDCSKLTSIDIPDSVYTVCAYAFDGCSALTTVEIGKNVNSIGENAFRDCSSITDVKISSIENWFNISFDTLNSNPLYNAKKLYVNNALLSELVIPNTVESIGEYSLAGYKGLKSVVFHDGVTEICSNAFLDCSNIEKVKISSLEKWCEISFAGCESNPLNYADNLYLNNKLINALSIPRTVTSVSEYAFTGYKGLTSVIIPDGVKTINAYAFYNCENLVSVSITKNIADLVPSAFYNCNPSLYTEYAYGKYLCSDTNPYAVLLKITNVNKKSYNVNENAWIISSNVFSSCNQIENITIPDSVSTLCSDAFSGCESLKGVYITSIADWCNISFVNTSANPLYYANKLYLGSEFDGSLIEELVIPSSVTSIAPYAFYNCTGITSVKISNGNLNIIGENAFYGCTSLKGIYLTNIADWCDISFANTSANPLYYAKNIYLNNNVVKQLVIPSSVTSIAPYAFYNCTGITSVKIGSGNLNSVGEDAFYGCTNLKDIYLTSIADWCKISFANPTANPLSGAKNLYLNGSLVKELVIPSSVTSIGSYAFYNYTSLTSVKISNINLNSIGENAFYGCSTLDSVCLTSIEDWCDVSFANKYSNPLFYAKKLYLGIKSDDSLVKELLITDNVTSIAPYAFYNCTSITSVKIGKNLKSIGEDAFYGCSSLTGVYITDIKDWCDVSFANPTANPLSGAKNLYVNTGRVTELQIPDNVTSIGAYAFYNCTSITSVKIGNNLESIGEDAFYGCSKLSGVYITSIPNWCNTSFATPASNPLYCAKKLYLNNSLVTALEIPETVAYIGAYAFYNCTEINSVSVGYNVREIGEDAFYGCSKLKGVYITNLPNWCNISFANPTSNPLTSAKNLYLGNVLVEELVILDGIAIINNYAFYNCTSLTSVVIADSVQSIGHDAFGNCTNLTSVSIGKGVKSIGNNAFYGCKSLISAIIPDNVISIGDSAFYNCAGLVSVSIGKGVESIGENAFFGCSNLSGVYITNLPNWCNISFANPTANPLYYAKKLYLGSEFDGSLIEELVIPSSVTSIGDYAFYNCTSITSVKIGSGVKNIGEGAFYNCTGLTSVEISNSVTEIGNDAFHNCTVLSNINYKGSKAKWFKDVNLNNNTFKTATVSYS